MDRPKKKEHNDGDRSECGLLSRRTERTMIERIRRVPSKGKAQVLKRGRELVSDFDLSWLLLSGDGKEKRESLVEQAKNNETLRVDQLSSTSTLMATDRHPVKGPEADATQASITSYSLVALLKGPFVLVVALYRLLLMRLYLLHLPKRDSPPFRPSFVLLIVPAETQLETRQDDDDDAVCQRTARRISCPNLPFPKPARGEGACPSRPSTPYPHHRPLLVRVSILH